jgi:hypothetical protein
MIYLKINNSVHMYWTMSHDIFGTVSPDPNFKCTTDLVDISKENINKINTTVFETMIYTNKL